MKDLIERLEKATGPDTELDAAIYALTDPNNAIAVQVWTKFQRDTLVPRYTGDDIGPALGLVPAGFDVSVYVNAASSPKGRHCGAVVRQPCDSGSKKDRGEICETCHGRPSAAIALCIAALRARA